VAKLAIIYDLAGTDTISNQFRHALCKRSQLQCGWGMLNCILMTR